MFPTTVDSNHLPLELWYTAWGDMETCCPDFPSSVQLLWKCCQWATLNYQPLWGQTACNDPYRWRYKGLASGHVRTTLKGHLHSRHHMESAKVIWTVIQLDVFLCLICSSLILQMLSLRAPLIHIPTLKSVWVCIPENQSAVHNNNNNKILVFEKFYLKITGYIHITFQPSQIE